MCNKVLARRISFIAAHNLVGEYHNLIKEGSGLEVDISQLIPEVYSALLTGKYRYLDILDQNDGEQKKTMSFEVVYPAYFFSDSGTRLITRFVDSEQIKLLPRVEAVEVCCYD